MGVLSARPGPSSGPAPRRARAPWLWSLALHGAVFAALAHEGTRPTRPAEVVFSVQMASAPSEADAPAVEEVLVEPPPDDDLLVPQPPATPDAVPEPPPLEPEEPVLPDEREALPAPATPAATPVGPRTATTRTHRPPPVPPIAAPALPPPVRAQPVAAPASAASAGASAVVGARPDASNRPPVYPTDARANRWTGVVTLRLDVDAGGAVRGVAIAVSSGYMSLDRAAADAAWGWRFSPAHRDGVGIASAVLRRVRFVLDGA